MTHLFVFPQHIPSAPSQVLLEQKEVTAEESKVRGRWGAQEKDRALLSMSFCAEYTQKACYFYTSASEICRESDLRIIFHYACALCGRRNELKWIRVVLHTEAFNCTTKRAKINLHYSLWDLDMLSEASEVIHVHLHSTNPYRCTAALNWCGADRNRLKICHLEVPLSLKAITGFIVFLFFF